MTTKDSMCLISYQIAFDKGSEYGSAYQIVQHIVQKYPNLTLISRKKNIDLLKNDPLFAKSTLIALDVPKYLSFYKKKERGITLYYMTWLYLVAQKVKSLGDFSLIYLVNFHGDKTPHFFKNPNGSIMWGPLAHHPFIPPEFIYREPRSLYIGFEYIKILTKKMLWYSPWMMKALRNSDVIYCGNPKDLPPTFKRFPNKVKILNVVARPFDIKEQTNPSQDGFRLLFIGRFIDIKGTIFTLQTFHEFYKNHPDSHLTMIGKGPLHEELESYIKSNNLESAVDIINWLPQDELFEHYQNSHVFFFPSMEAQGLVVTEAMQFGLPIVCLKDYGPHSIAREVAISIPYQKGNIQATKTDFITSLSELYNIKNQSQYLELRQKTRKEYEKNQHAPQLVSTILEDIDTLLNNKT
ncbi:MAG: hypothetical protein CL916_10645 [Deltaproteobacteria bacterium]|nr:hypothetical protein [Deltaproteobacteria bacterium]